MSARGGHAKHDMQGRKEVSKQASKEASMRTHHWLYWPCWMRPRISIGGQQIILEANESVRQIRVRQIISGELLGGELLGCKFITQPNGVRLQHVFDMKECS